MTKLSPAAQAVLDAFKSTKFADHYTIAAAIRAIADQVVPERDMPFFVDDFNFGVWDARKDTRDKLFTVAAELEVQ
jgi:hypothetical protein